MNLQIEYKEVGILGTLAVHLREEIDFTIQTETPHQQLHFATFYDQHGTVYLINTVSEMKDDAIVAWGRAQDDCKFIAPTALVPSDATIFGFVAFASEVI